MHSSSNRILNLVVDQRFQKCPDGSVWSHTPPTYPFFEQMLQVFDRVRVIARTSMVDYVPERTRRVDGPRVEVFPVPSYTGPFQYMRQRAAVSAAVDRVAQMDGAFLLRIPSQTGFMVASRLEQMNRPYATELLTDPYDFFAMGVSSHSLAYFFRPYFCRRSKDLCARAVAANFVTGSRTRAAHPTPVARWNSSISDVDLPPEAFLEAGCRQAGKRLELINVGFLDLLYKGQDGLIRALGQCARAGLDFGLTFAGDGENRHKLIALAAAQGIADRVRITGPLGGPQEVRDWLAKSDLFVLPSRAEGIPRALLEAMAAGLPAICSNVGAMPDLIEERWVVRPGDDGQLAARILEFAASRSEWAAMGQRNQSVVRSFENAKLLPQRLDFYRAVREACAENSNTKEILNAP